jgi:hypothetical protein
MMRPRRASMLITLPPLVSAATASAECAWVFWLEAGVPRTHEVRHGQFRDGEREKLASGR